MSYPDAAADLARSLADLSATRAGAALAPTSSPAGDEIALHAALRARGEVLNLVRTIAADVAPITDVQQFTAQRTNARVGGRIAAAEVAGAMRLGRLPLVAAFAHAVAAHPQVPLRFPDTDPAITTQARTAAWVAAGHHALVAAAGYARAGGAAPDGAPEAARWSAATDAAAIAQLLTHLDADLALSLGAHHLATPAARQAMAAAVAAGPGLAEAAQGLRTHTSWRGHSDYATTENPPHRVIAVDCPQTLARGQARLATLIDGAAILSPSTISQILNTQQRLATTAAAALAEVDPTRAATARATATSLAAAAPQRATLSTALASITREDPAPALQNREITTYLRAQRAQGPPSPGRELAGALDTAPAVLRAAITSARAAVMAGTWLTSAPVPAEAGPLGAYPWQRATSAVIAPLLTRLNVAASHHGAGAAFPTRPTARITPGPPAREMLRAALERRPTPTPTRGPRPGISR